MAQDSEHDRGKPIVYSVGNFVMKETGNEHQRQGRVLRMVLDKAGVRLSGAHVSCLDLPGIAHRDPVTPSPCWLRGGHRRMHSG